MKLRLIAILFGCACILAVACGDDSNPAGPGNGGPTPFNTSSMPITVPGVTTSSGNPAFGKSGDLMLATMGGIVYKVSRSSGKLGILAAGIGAPDRLMCAVYDPIADRVYAGAAQSHPNNVIYTINPNTLESSPLLTVTNGGWLHQLLIAPAGFGAHGGKLLVMTFTGTIGGVLAIDQTAPGAPVNVSDQQGTDMEFAPDGTLYVADYSNDQVVTVSPAGVATPFANGFNAPEGIAINSTGTLMYVSSDDAVDQIYSVTIPGAVPTPIATITIQGGSFPTGLLLDGTGQILYGGGTGQMIIDSIDI